MSDEDKRSLKVKAGVVKRLRKELDMYAAEVATETAKVQQLRNAGADPHDIKYQVGCRDECPCGNGANAEHTVHPPMAGWAATGNMCDWRQAALSTGMCRAFTLGMSAVSHQPG